MKNISTRTGVLTLSLVIASLLWNADHESVASPVLHANTESALPVVALQWRVTTFMQWCNCEGASCTPPGRMCIPDQEMRLDSAGGFESIGACAVQQANLGQVEVLPHVVSYSGPKVDVAAWVACTADCCTAAECGNCYVGGPDFVSSQRLTFDFKVWPKFLNGITGDNGSAGEPQSDFELYFANQMAGPFAYTRTQADFNADGFVNGEDLGWLLQFWSQPWWPRIDLNRDGEVNGADLAILLNAWGPCP